MNIEIKTFKKSNGQTFQYFLLSFNKGKKYLEKLGYKPMPNKNFMMKDNTYVHYNSIMKAWILD